MWRGTHRLQLGHNRAHAAHCACAAFLGSCGAAGGTPPGGGLQRQRTWRRESLIQSRGCSQLPLQRQSKLRAWQFHTSGQTCTRQGSDQPCQGLQCSRCRQTHHVGVAEVGKAMPSPLQRPDHAHLVHKVPPTAAQGSLSHLFLGGRQTQGPAGRQATCSMPASPQLRLSLRSTCPRA